MEHNTHNVTTQCDRLECSWINVASDVRRRIPSLISRSSPSKSVTSRSNKLLTCIRTVLLIRRLS
jgi:hypothetical protein